MAGVLVTVGGIICTASHELAAIVASNWLDGIAFGMTTVMFIVVAGENSDAHIRGKLVSTEALSVSTGCLMYNVLQTIFSLVDTNNFSMIQAQGVISIVFGVFACGSSFWFIETPVYHLTKGDQNEALNTLSALHNETEPSLGTHRAYEELQGYVHYDDSKSVPQHVIDGILPLAKIVMLRVFMLLTLVFPVPFALLLTSVNGYKIGYGMVFYGVARWVGAVIGHLALIESNGRKMTVAVCSLVIGIFFIVIGSFLNGYKLYSVSATLFLITNFFCGMSQNVSTVYLSEAFPPSIKSGMIFAAIFMENIAAIIVFAIMRQALYNGALGSYFYAIGAFQLLLVVIALLLLPETKKLSLQKAMALLQRPLSLR